ncbi:MAG TPA: hypothetical protein VLF90_03830 [Patescibacteria group bacterium]|nr:hypothetical protein [Patescibacteria group bacterium]
MPNRVLEVIGPEALPDAAISLLDNRELDILHVRKFFLPSYLPRLNALTSGINADLCPPIYEYGPSAAEALTETASRAGEWLVQHGCEDLEPLGDFISGEVLRFGLQPHIDRPVVGEDAGREEGENKYISGPLVAVIGLRGRGLSAAKRGELVIDGRGKYDNPKHWELYNQFNNRYYRYWFEHRDEYSHVMQHPTDLVMFTNTPDPTEHAGIALSRRKAGVYELGYKVPLGADRRELPNPLPNFLAPLQQGM